MVQHFSQICGCNGEWLLHSYFMRFALAVVIYICLNCSRIMVVAGVAKLLWRHLSTGEFRFIDACTEEGLAMAARDEAALEKAVKSKLRWHQRTGAVQFFIAWCLTVPWVWALIYVAGV